MLLLSRKQGESLVIEVEGLPQPIEIMLQETGPQTRIGVSAPENCKICRKELYQTILENRQAAAAAKAEDTRAMAKALLGGMGAANKKPAENDGLKSE